MSRKAGNYTGYCYKLQRFRDSLIVDSGTSSSTDTMTSDQSGNERPMIRPGPTQIQEREQETLDKNKRVVRLLVERAKTDRGMIGLWAFYNNEKDPSSDEYLVKNEEDRDIYYMFIDTCVVNMITKAAWKTNHDAKPMSKYISVSDEAFAMLILENIAQSLIDDEAGQAGGVTGAPLLIGSKRTTKYTKGGRDADGKMRGWRRRGIERFNDLCKDVIVRRAITEICQQLELDLKKRYQKEKIAEEEAEDVLEVEGERSGSRKRDFVQGYDNNNNNSKIILIRYPIQRVL